MRKDNKGITLVELIVIIAIMAVLTAAFGVSFALIGRQKVSNAAAGMKQTIQLAQSYAKSKGACKMRVTGTGQEGSNTYIYTANNAADLKDISKCKLGNGPNNINKNITIKVKLKKGSAETIVTIGAGHHIDFYFDRKTGGFLNAYIDDSTTSLGTPIEIEFSNNQKSTTLYLATYTGVVTYNK